MDGVAQFRGPKKACMKECVLIIDTQSGEAILEKISNTVQLKAVRYVHVREEESVYCICVHPVLEQVVCSCML